MILPIKNKDNFIKSFLNPVSRLAPSSTLNVDDKISTVVHNNSNIFLRAEYNVSWEDHPPGTALCLPDTIKLIKILSCLDEDSIELKIGENCITYSNNNNRFKYHLFDDSLKTKIRLYQYQIQLLNRRIQDEPSSSRILSLHLYVE